MSIAVIFLVLALVCFLLATANYPTGMSIGWLGAAFVVMSLLIPALR